MDAVQQSHPHSLAQPTTAGKATQPLLAARQKSVLDSSMPTTTPTSAPVAPTTSGTVTTVTLHALRRFPLVSVTLLVAAIAGILGSTAWAPAVPWLLGGYSLAIAAKAAWAMIGELRSGTFGIDILAVTAISAAVSVGEYWAALIIVLMLTGGEALEDFAEHRAKRELESLLNHAPRIAHRIGHDGTSQDIPLDEVAVGDLLTIRPGEVVPVDGTLHGESAEFDESSLTGESVPVQRHPGDEVLSGGVNGSRPVTIRVLRSAAESQYQQIIALVADATESKPPLVRVADRYAIPFTIIALCIAGAAWAISGEAVRFAEVLVVATPCPLIIAAPVAFMGGMSRAARAGAIIKNSGTLELLSKTQTVAFDKTGTLTSGTPSVQHIITHADTPHTPEEILANAAAAEQHSTHPLARAIVAAATERGLDIPPAQAITEHTANGVEATVAARQVLVGKAHFLSAQLGHGIPPIEHNDGTIAVHVAIGNQAAGVLILQDTIRPEAAATIAALHTQGVTHLLMVTGDAETTAQRVAETLHITEVHANCLPGDKLNIITNQRSRPVVMVGDGVNDAPVLAAADVGIALGARGSTAASESADVVVLRDTLSTVASVHRIGTETFAIALQSIWAGIGLSLALMVVSAFGFIPATIGAWSQELIDIVAIGWALRALKPGAADR